MTFRWISYLSIRTSAAGCELASFSSGTQTRISIPERLPVEAAITGHQGHRDSSAKTPSAITVQLAIVWNTISLSLSLQCLLYVSSSFSFLLTPLKNITFASFLYSTQLNLVYIAQHSRSKVLYSAHREDKKTKEMNTRGEKSLVSSLPNQLNREEIYISDANCSTSACRSNRHHSQHSWNENKPHMFNSRQTVH